ncbi:MAG TPA: hypothetical protein PKY81_02040 [bacterium]|nr:hypothetical protein [bacterium]
MGNRFLQAINKYRKKCNEKNYSTREEIENYCSENYSDYIKFYEIDKKNNIYFIKKNQKKLTRKFKGSEHIF